MYMKRTIRKAPADVKALMRIANGLELELRALKREIEARRDAQVESHERLGNILETRDAVPRRRRDRGSRRGRPGRGRGRASLPAGGGTGAHGAFRPFDDLGHTQRAHAAVVGAVAGCCERRGGDGESGTGPPGGPGVTGAVVERPAR